ncbi:methyltransferase domain-containing protein [Ulvibacter antarcticus]|uniref:Methyltransferase family protein n=1 Tax=Ulvibacter antarcticus TaxID=442714 RepID=A0A3L9YC91_9FLAO|nr:methyltransferase domain-containing protein [Ulvibacter antarcticus]RMA56729.1 methyltransferase family protein [Ulvibacter antarcticus]
MYSVFKKLAKRLLPKKLLYKHETFLRSVFAFHYRGKIYQCNTCNHSLKSFVELDDHDLLCPFCGSRARTRRLYSILKENALIKGDILHFSPSRSLYRILNADKNITYHSTDFEDEFIAQFQYDITNIPCDDDSFDLIICYHILEHIIEDTEAMKELYRVLKPGGLCLIQTPFKEGNDIYEDYSIISEEERLKAFGQEDHVRVYSVHGLKERLEKAGFTIEIQSFSEEKNNREGFLSETVLEARK